jgi:hypothetical protein
LAQQQLLRLNVVQLLHEAEKQEAITLDSLDYLIYGELSMACFK